MGTDRKGGSTWVQMKRTGFGVLFGGARPFWKVRERCEKAKNNVSGEFKLNFGWGVIKK